MKMSASKGLICIDDLNYLTNNSQGNILQAVAQAYLESSTTINEFV